MTTPVNIDISDFIDKWNLKVEQVNVLAFNILDRLAVEYSENLKKKVAKELHQTRNDYIRSIYVEKEGNFAVIVGLKGWLANAVEQGIGAFDIKDGFKGSAKRRTKRDGGWFITVPFRHGTPGIIGDSAIFSKPMPVAIYKVAQRLSSGQQLSRKQLPAQFQNLGIRPEVISQRGQVFSQYSHKSSIYEGMQRSDKQNHGEYVTFRRVSDLSDKDAWIHTGIQARNLALKTLKEFDIASNVAKTKIDFFKTL